jgi:hypothetical protein
MQKLIKVFSIFLLLTAITLLGGCDKFDSLPLNIPFSIPFSITGSNSSYSSGTYCLDTQSQVYQDNFNKIKNLSYIKSALNISDISDPNTSLELTVSVNKENGDPIFSFIIPNFKPADYMDKAYKIDLNQDQIIAFNAYLENLNNNCFEASISASGLEETQSVSGNLDLVLEADTKL